MKTLKIIAIPIGVALLLYGLAAFVSLEIDPRKWETAWRGMMAWCWFVASSGAISWVVSSDRWEARK